MTCYHDWAMDQQRTSERTRCFFDSYFAAWERKRQDPTTSPWHSTRLLLLLLLLLQLTSFCTCSFNGGLLIIADDEDKLSRVVVHVHHTTLIPAWKRCENMSYI